MIRNSCFIYPGGGWGGGLVLYYVVCCIALHAYDNFYNLIEQF